MTRNMVGTHSEPVRRRNMYVSSGSIPVRFRPGAPADSAPRGSLAVIAVSQATTSEETIRTDPDDRHRVRTSTVHTSLERHGRTGWYEWALREFIRYLFGVGILGLFVFVPLQMELSWLPSDAPPIL